MVTVALYWASAIHADHGKWNVLITLGKIAISLVQVITQLEFSLSVSWTKIPKALLESLCTGSV